MCLPRPWPCDRGCSVYIKTDIIEIVGGRRRRAQPVVVNLSYRREPQRQWPVGGSALEARLTALCCSWQRASPLWVYWFTTNGEPTEVAMHCLTSDLNLFYLLLIHGWCSIRASLSKDSVSKKNVQELMIPVIPDMLELRIPEYDEKSKNWMKWTVMTSIMKA